THEAQKAVKQDRKVGGGSISRILTRTSKDTVLSQQRNQKLTLQTNKPQTLRIHEKGEPKSNSPSTRPKHPGENEERYDGDMEVDLSGKNTEDGVGAEGDTGMVDRIQETTEDIHDSTSDVQDETTYMSTTESLSSSKDGTSVETVKRVIEMANRALLRREILYTDFLTPPLLRDSMLALEKLADIRAVRHGGYPEAERCRISVEHQDVKANNDADVVVALSITGNFKFQACNHGDFLGSVLGTGISREKVGDIILQGEKGAQIIVVPELADFIITSLDKVGNVSVSCTRISLDELEYEPPNTKTFKTVEASIRLDALASAGFKISRTKLVDLISKGDVRVNWNTALKNGAILRIGDVVSVSGMGRLKIGEINVTKKGKYSVELIRSFEVYGVYCYVTLSRLTAY
ncbi:hypothetical protein V2J09_007331, partial [Rumex salicifolius]